MEREGVTVDCVAGTSVGSLVGALYCGGVGVQHLIEIAEQIGWRNLASLRPSSRGFFSFEKLERWLIALLGDIDFSDLRTPFAAVATDLETGEPVVLREGRLAPAVRASCSIPGIFRPVQMNARFLVDGVISDNLPVAAARGLGAEYVIGVDICRPWPGRRWGPFGIGFAAVENLARRAGGGLAEADCLITPDLAGTSYVRFSQAEDLIARGRSAAEETLPIIESALLTHP
jgi:NTE family protein